MGGRGGLVVSREMRLRGEGAKEDVTRRQLPGSFLRVSFSFTHLQGDQLVVDAADKGDAGAVLEDAGERSLEAQRDGALRVAKLPQLGGGADEDAGAVVGEGSEGDAGHGADGQPGVAADDAHVDELFQQDDADGDALGVGGEDDEVGVADVVDPVEHQAPEVVDPVADPTVALEGDFFNLAVGRAVRVSPAADRVGAEAGQTERRPRWLPDDGTEVG